MKSLALCILVLAGAAPVLRCAERSVERSFPAAPGCHMNLDTYRGRVDVVEGPDERISVEVRMTVPTDDAAAADAAFRTVQLEMKPEGGGAVVQARNPRQTRLHFDWQEDRQVDLNYRISVPRSCDLHLRIGRGGLVVGDLTGRMWAECGTGPIYFKRISGSVHAATGDGGIVVSECSGDAELDARSGSILVGKVGGAARLHSVNGDIELQRASGAVAIRTDLGDVALGLQAVVPGGVDVATDGGGIRLQIASDAACLVRASSILGGVHFTVPLTVLSGGSGRRSLAASLGGGGPSVVLKASGGRITIDPLHGELPAL